MDPTNLSLIDIQNWVRNAPQQQVVQAAHTLLDKVATFDDSTRENFIQRLPAQTRSKLFANEPVA